MLQTPASLQNSSHRSGAKRRIPRRRIQLPPNALRRVWELFQAQQIHEGPHLSRFEEAFRQAVGTQSAIGVASARVGLYLSLQAFGFAPEDEIICPAYTFHALPEMIRASGLVPVFVDSDPVTYNLDPALIEKAITPKTKAILITHLFGQPCDLEPILSIARRHRLKLIEDCAHACGAEYQNQRVGSFGDVGLFSLGPGKHLPSFGGGVVTTHDPEIAERLRNWVNRGTTPTTFQHLREVVKTFALAWGTAPQGFRFAGYPLLRLIEALSPGASDRLMEETQGSAKEKPSSTIRLANLQAAVGLEQLATLEDKNSARRKHAEYLNEALTELAQLQLPKALPETRSTYLYYRVLVEDRDSFRRELLRRGVDSKRDDMSNCGGPAFPIAARLAGQSVELPNGPDLNQSDLDQIVYAVRKTVLQQRALSARSVIPAPSSTLKGR